MTSTRTVGGEAPVAIVTGGSSGLGRTIAERLLSDGFIVASLARRNAPPSRGDESRLITLTADVTRSDQVEAAVRAAREKGRVFVLVNNAGISGPVGPAEKVSLDEWSKTLETNLTGAFICCRSVIPDMIGGGTGGRIINVSSMVGKTAVPFRAAYSASKMGLIGLTRSLSRELGRYQITVNAVCPGPIEGERIKDVIRRNSLLTGGDPESATKAMKQRASLRRFTEPEEVAAVVSFLASARGYAITGQDVNVNSGSGP